MEAEGKYLVVREYVPGTARSLMCLQPRTAEPGQQRPKWKVKGWRKPDKYYQKLHCPEIAFRVPHMECRLRLYLVLAENSVIVCETKFRSSEYILDRKTIFF